MPDLYLEYRLLNYTLYEISSTLSIKNILFFLWRKCIIDIIKMEEGNLSSL